MVNNTEPRSLSADVADPFTGVDFSQLERSLRRPRTLVDFLLNAVVSGMTLLSLILLFSVVLLLAWRGGRRPGTAASATRASCSPMPAKSGSSRST